MASQVDIANIAMHHLGQDEITSLSDNSKRAALCNSAYPRLLDVMLSEYVWGFSRKRAILAPSTTSPLFNTDYTYAFTLPSDYMRLESMTDYDSDFLLENGALLSNTNPLDIRYIARVTDPNMMTPLFREAFGLRIAIDIVALLVGSETLKQELKQTYREVMASARTSDAQSEGEGKQPEDTWLSARDDGWTGPI